MKVPARTMARFSSRHVLFAGLTLSLVFFALMCILGLDDHSATYDEPVYIASGRAAAEWGDFRLKPDTPPLVPLIANMAVRLGESPDSRLDPLILRSALQSGRAFDNYAVSRAYVHSAGNNMAGLRHARLPFILLGMIGIIYAGLFARMLCGDLGGLVTCLFLAADPTWQAHSSIVACDVPLASCIIISVYHLMAFLKSPGRIHFSLFLTGIILASLVKYSAPLLAPMAMTILFLRRPFPRAWIRFCAVACAAAFAVFLILVCLCYGSPRGIPAYFKGFSYVYSNVPPDNVYYLMGGFKRGTWLHYYPLATLIKLPAASLCAILFGLLALCLCKTRLRAFAPVLIGIFVVYGVSLFDKTNYCIRRVLPAFPFLYVLPSVLIGLETGRPVLGRPLIRTFVILACFTSCLVAIISHPNQMSSISLLFGGNGCGPNLVSDCNVDWGQDLPALAQYQKTNHLERITLLYQGQGDPQAYGIHSREMTPGEWESPLPEVYAISANILIYKKFDALTFANPRLNWLERFTPAATAGESIRIYDFRKAAGAASQIPNP